MKRAIESRVNRILQETWRYEQTWRTALSEEDIVLSPICILLLDDKKQTKEEEN